MTRKRLRLGGSLVIALALLAGSLGPHSVQALSRSQTQQIIRSVVQIVAVEEGSGGRVNTKWGGSGTIISADGLILTNCHVALPSAMYSGKQYSYDALVVGLTTRSDEVPSFTYLAEVAQYDPDLDLAVIRIVKSLDGTPLDRSKLSLPFVPVGDSDSIEIGDPISILGYPAIGGDTVTLTTGNVSGFSRERGFEGRAWIKTDATIAGGNSGGTALTEDGKLVGVPTRIGVTDDTNIDCRPMSDTNGDGAIDQRDTCVPVGGFINALRPVNLATQLIQAAARGLAPRPTPVGKRTAPASTGTASVSRLFFAPEVFGEDQPLTVVESFPSGTQEMYLFFDYEGFVDGTSWQPILTFAGKEYEDTWQARGWAGGSSGNWWISLSGEPLDDGAYELSLYYDGRNLGSAKTSVGGATRAMPTFSSIAFSAEGQEGYAFPVGTKKLEATFEYENATQATRWSYIWYYEGKAVASDEGNTLSAKSGTGALSLTKATGFDSGAFRLELYIGDALACTSDFSVRGEAAGTRDVFGPITFAPRLARDGTPIDAGTALDSGIAELHGIFSYQGMKDDWEWGRRWSIDGEDVVDSTDAWDGGADGDLYDVWISTREEALPDGAYNLELEVEGQLVQSGSVTVGTPSAKVTPTALPAARLLDIHGSITDGDTGRGISGAAFIVLKPGISHSAFTWTEAEVHTSAEADARGYYELPQPLVRGETYTMLVGARGYKTVIEEDVTVSETTESPTRVDISLQQAQ